MWNTFGRNVESILSVFRRRHVEHIQYIFCIYPAEICKIQLEGIFNLFYMYLVRYTEEQH